MYVRVCIVHIYKHMACACACTGSASDGTITGTMCTRLLSLGRFPAVSAFSSSDPLLPLWHLRRSSTPTKRCLKVSRKWPELLVWFTGRRRARQVRAPCRAAEPMRASSIRLTCTVRAPALEAVPICSCGSLGQRFPISRRQKMQKHVRALNSPSVRL